jgi:hypothetical protein
MSQDAEMCLKSLAPDHGLKVSYQANIWSRMLFCKNRDKKMTTTDRVSTRFVIF